MKRKKFLGILGLVVVAVVTVVAVLVPAPDTSALDTNPVTDEVTVRVVGSTPDVNIIKPEDSSSFVNPEQYFSFDYMNIETATATIKYIDADGTENIYTIDTINPDYAPGTSSNYTLNLLGESYGYGEYEISVLGIGFDGVTDEDTVGFSFHPVTGEIEESKEEGIFNLILDYDMENEEIDTLVINVYNSEGRLMAGLSNITVKAPETEVKLPFAKNNIDSGDYYIEIIAYGSNGEPLYDEPYVVDLKYEKPLPVPDTGSFFGISGVARTDLVITGAIAFTLIAAIAAVLVIRSQRKTKK